MCDKNKRLEEVLEEIRMLNYVVSKIHFEFKNFKKDIKNLKDRVSEIENDRAFKDLSGVSKKDYNYKGLKLIGNDEVMGIGVMCEKCGLAHLGECPDVWK